MPDINGAGIRFCLIFFVTYDKMITDMFVCEELNMDNEKIMVETDYLTGLANRCALNEYYNSIDKELVVHTMFIDIDNFKRVNDIYGHSMGDELLVCISSLIESCVDGFV